MQNSIGRAMQAPARYKKSRRTRKGGYDKGVFGKKKTTPKVILRKKAD